MLICPPGSHSTLSTSHHPVFRDRSTQSKFSFLFVSHFNRWQMKNTSLLLLLLLPSLSFPLSLPPEWPQPNNTFIRDLLMTRAGPFSVPSPEQWGKLITYQSQQQGEEDAVPTAGFFFHPFIPFSPFFCLSCWSDIDRPTLVKYSVDGCGWQPRGWRACRLWSRLGVSPAGDVRLIKTACLVETVMKHWWSFYSPPLARRQVQDRATATFKRCNKERRWNCSCCQLERLHLGQTFGQFTPGLW